MNKTSASPPQLVANPLPVATVLLPVSEKKDRGFCQLQSGEILVAASPVRADNVIDFSVARNLTKRRVFAYIFAAAPTNPAWIEGVVRFWLNGSVVAELPVEYSLQPATSQSRLTPFRSGGQSDDALIAYLAGGLVGEFSVVGINPVNLAGEIDQVTVSVKTVSGVTGYRIICAVESSNP